MKSEIVAVLLVPAEGDPLGLLTEGPCGARSPRAVRQVYPRVVHDECLDCDEGDHGRYAGGEWHTHCNECGEVWPCPDEGKVVAEERVRWKPANRYTSVPGALVLAWGGKVVPEGADRWWRALPVKYIDENGRPRRVLRHPAYWESVEELAGLYGPELLGCTLVLLDSDGREVTP